MEFSKFVTCTPQKAAGTFKSGAGNKKLKTDDRDSAIWHKQTSPVLFGLTGAYHSLK
jgi:hypothetical protein